MRYIFGEFSLDAERVDLRRAGCPIRLQPKAFKVLSYLIARRDRVVSKLSREQGFPFWEGTGMVLWGWASARGGQLAAGIDALQDGIDRFRSTGAEIQLSSWYGLLAEAWASAGRVDPGGWAVNEALNWVEKTGERYYESELYRLRGGLLNQEGRWEQAERCCRQAVRVARRQQSRVRELRAAVDLAELLRARGERVAAVGLVKPLYDSFTEGHDSPDLQRADALIKMLV